MSLINFLKKIIPLKFKTFLKKFRKFNSINCLDKKLLKYVNFKNGFYVECGANDGINQSNSWYYERNMNWKGILIEPNKKKFQELKRNRSSRNIFVNAALVSKKFKLSNKKIYLTNDNLESKVTNVYNPSCEKVYADTLGNILKRYSIKKINFFSLDVEGYEQEVLKGLDLKNIIIDYILIETSYYKKISLMLKKYNYIFKEKFSSHDYLFKKKIY